MNLPPELFSLTIKEREIFLFETTKINSPDPHFFICIKKNENDILLFTCCTTKGNKREEYITKKGYPLSTLVHINHNNSDNPFTAPTFVDCNKCIPFTIEEFEKMCNERKATYKGEISSEYYEQILIGLLASPEIDNEIKQQLPNPNEIV